MNKTTRENEEKKEDLPQNRSDPEKTVCDKMLKIRPTIAELEIAQNLLAGATQHHACRAAGYADKTARYHSTEIVNRPGVQTALAEALERIKGTKDAVA
jgi:hypothetical protein